MLVITTAKAGHHIHRDTCPRIVPKANPIPAFEAEPDTVLEARSCSRCSPRPADVGRALADAEARKETAPTAPAPKELPDLSVMATRQDRKASKNAPDGPQTDERPEVGTDTPTQRCTGACGRVLPLTKFPTTAKGGRGTECRHDRDARRAAAKAG